MISGQRLLENDFQSYRHAQCIDRNRTTDSDSGIRRGASSYCRPGRLDGAPERARPELECSPGGGGDVECPPQVDVGNAPGTQTIFYM